MSQHDQLTALIEPWLSAERVELDDLEIVGSGRGRTVRVVVDADGGVDVDLLSELSSGVSALLDARSDIDGPYQLELTSPGLERKLKRPRHYVKSVGREVRVKVRVDDGTEVLEGRLVTAGDDAFDVEVADGVRHIGYEAVTSAKTIFRWESAPKPGKGPKAGTK